MKNSMENKVKRIGYLPRKRVLEIIDEISTSESISRSKVVGILVEEALDARGIANFGYSNINKSNSYKSDNSQDFQEGDTHLKIEDAEFILTNHYYLNQSPTKKDEYLYNNFELINEIIVNNNSINSIFRK